MKKRYVIFLILISCTKHPLVDIVPDFENITLVYRFKNTFDEDKFVAYNFNDVINENELKLYPRLKKDSEGKVIVKWKKPQKIEERELLDLLYSSYGFHNNREYRKYLLNILKNIKSGKKYYLSYSKESKPFISDAYILFLDSINTIYSIKAFSVGFSNELRLKKEVDSIISPHLDI